MDLTKIPLVFNVKKPAGISSFDVVHHFKKNLNFNFGKIGHVSRVENPAERSNDRVRALKMLAQAAALAAVIALVCTFVSA